MGGFYTILCKDKVIVDKEINNIKQQLSSSYDEYYYSMGDNSLSEVIEELSTISMFSDFKLLVVRDFNLAFSDKKNLDYINRIVQIVEKRIDDVLILVFSQSVNDSLYKRLKSISRHLSFEQLDQSNAFNYIQDYLLREQFTISKPAAMEIISRTQMNFDLISLELDKLILHNMQTKNIELDDVFLLVSKNIEDNIFSLVDLVLQKDVKNAFSLYSEMLRSNLEQTAIISLLLNKFNEMYDVRVLVDERVSKDDLSLLYNVKPGRAYYMIKAATSTSKENILDNINRLSELEFNIKSGKEDKKTGFELFLLNLK